MGTIRFDSSRRFELQRAADQRLQREETEPLFAAVGQIFLVTADARVLVAILDAAGPAPAIAFGLDEVGAHLAAIAEEAGADRAIGVELVMVIL